MIINLILGKHVDSRNFIYKDYGHKTNFKTFNLNIQVKIKLFSSIFIIASSTVFFRHLCVEEAQRASSLISILIEVFSKSAPIILICNIVISVDLLLLIRTREIDRYGLFRYNERRHTFSTQLITETMDKYCECEKYFFNNFSVSEGMVFMKFYN